MRGVHEMGTRSRFHSPSTRFGSAGVVPIVDFLLIAAFVVDLITPFFVWKGILPSPVSWISQFVAAVAVGVAYTRMMILNRIPWVILIIAGLSALGIVTAVLRGQGVVSTLWGWWIVFKYPLLGVYAYLRPGWSDRFPQRLANLCLALLGFEVVFQIGQYLTGEPIGDNLAGTFGWHGVGPLLFLTVFALSVALGQWLVRRKWLPLLLTLALGMVSGILAENKIFPLAAMLLAGLAIALLIVRGGQLWGLLVFMILLLVGVWVFATGYNTFVPLAQRQPLEQLYLDEDTRSLYLNAVHTSDWRGRQTYNMGRNLGVQYALGTIGGDPVTLIFGLGLGTRRESRSLGTTGLALQRDAFNPGSNLVVMIQEMGLAGVTLVGAFVLWVVILLLRDIRRYPESPALPLRYALFLFSVPWPLWLWYKTPLESRVAMLLYWVALGYVMSEAREHEVDVEAQAVAPMHWREGAIHNAR